LLDEDPAFLDRFNVMHVEEPDARELREILDAQAKYFSKHLDMPYGEQAIVEVAQRAGSLPGHLPRKAVDLLELAGGIARDECAAEVSPNHVALAVSFKHDAVPKAGRTDELSIADSTATTAVVRRLQAAWSPY